MTAQSHSLPDSHSQLNIERDLRLILPTALCIFNFHLINPSVPHEGSSLFEFISASHDTNFRSGTSLYTISLSTKTVITFAYTMAFILGLLGNGLGLYIAIRRSRKSFCSTNVLIGNMALADLLVTVFAMPQAVGFLLRNSFLKRPKSLTGLIWVVSLAIASPYLFSYTVIQDSKGQSYCVVVWGDVRTTYQSQRIYYLMIFIALYAVPLIFISAIYTLIAKKLWRRTASRDTNMVIRKSAMTQKRKVIRLLIVLVIVFAVCAAPAHVMHYYMFYDLARWLVIPIEVKLTSFWICHSNSTVNPVIYILLNETFRREFFRVMQSAMCISRQSLQFSSTKTRRNWKMKGTQSTRYWTPGKKRDVCL